MLSLVTPLLTKALMTEHRLSLSILPPILIDSPWHGVSITQTVLRNSSGDSTDQFSPSEAISFSREEGES